MNLTKEQAIEQIHGRVLAIKNDDKKALLKLLQIIWPNDKSSADGCSDYYGSCRGDYTQWTTLIDVIGVSTIPATELLRILEGEWMPEVGDPVQVSNDNNKWFGLNSTYFGKGTDKYPFLIKTEDGRAESWKFCRPIPKKQITIAELFEKAGLDEKKYDLILTKSETSKL